MSQPVPVAPESPASLINRELSWLSFARRVLALAEDLEQPGRPAGWAHVLPGRAVTSVSECQ
jgi:Polyphosphate kinase N-terminal domain